MARSKQTARKGKAKPIYPEENTATYQELSRIDDTENQKVKKQKVKKIVHNEKNKTKLFKSGQKRKFAEELKQVQMTEKSEDNDDTAEESEDTEDTSDKDDNDDTAEESEDTDKDDMLSDDNDDAAIDDQDQTLIPPAKKQKLHPANADKKPLTNEELNHLKETEYLFQSSLVRLQITELLEEITIKKKKTEIIDTFISTVKDKLCGLKSCSKHELTDTAYLKKHKIKLPLAKGPKQTKGRFQFLPPKVVKCFGSYTLGLATRPAPNIDLQVEMPKECFQAKDHLNQRYLQKRAFYLATIACQLKSCDIFEKISFTYHHGNHMRPILVLKPAADHGKGFIIRLHPYPEEGSFKLSRFAVEKNNIRSSWFLQSDEGNQDPPTPHYNSWVLQDLVQETNQGYIEHLCNDHQGIREGLVLLKVWLHQRQLDQGRGGFHTYIMTMYVTHLLAKRKLNVLMSSYQIVRNTLLHLSQCSWTSDGLSLASDTNADSNRPLLSDFHEAFDVVFVDRTGYLNICCDMSKATFTRVKYEASRSLVFLDASGLDGFEALFMIPVKFMMTFDQYFHISKFDWLETCMEKQNLKDKLIDQCGNMLAVCVPKLVALITKALGERVSLIDLQLIPCQDWAITSKPPSDQSTLVFGALINPEKAHSILDKGPYAENNQAVEFRNFWGTKSELRRFQDGTICEAVVWPCKTVADRRKITGKIVKHSLNRHAGISKDNITCVGSQLDSLLRLQSSNMTFPYGTGEEQCQHVHRCYDDLAKKLRNLENLPLTIHTMQGVSPLFRYAEVFPPMAATYKMGLKAEGKDIRVPVVDKQCSTWTPVIKILCGLETSGKWPEDKDALKHVKAAFLIKIGQLLQQQHGLTCQIARQYLDIFKDGYVFRLEISYLKEIALLKMVTTQEGMTKMVDTPEAIELERHLVALPTLTSTLHGLQQQYNSYGPSVCLAKRWLSSHMLLEGYIHEEVLELLMAHLYLTPAPYATPGSPLVAFLRFLTLLCTHDWQRSPLVVNLNDQLTRENFDEIQNHFTKNRASLPLLYIATSMDKLNSNWTRDGPTAVILQRLMVLAKDSLQILNSLLQDEAMTIDFKQVFRTPLDPFDVIIHIKSDQFSRQHHAVDITTDAYLPEFKEYEKSKGREFLPVVEYNPIQSYLAELRESYADIAMFFHDIYGGDIIAVLWKPAAFQEVSFKVSHLHGRMPVETSANEDTKLVPNVEAIIEAFKVLGEGIVKKVETKIDRWTI